MESQSPQPQPVAGQPAAGFSRKQPHPIFGNRRFGPPSPAHHQPVKPASSPINVEMWTCSSCTMSNESLLSECSICSSPRPAPKPGENAPEKFICHVCTFVNADVTATQCEMCGTRRELVVKASGGGNDENESKEDGEAQQHRFELGQAPPPLKRSMIVREHVAFLAGIEEAFGTIHVHPTLIRGVENLCRKQFEALLKNFQHVLEQPQHPSKPQHPLKSPAGNSPAKVAPSSPNAPFHALSPITVELVNDFLKAVVMRAAMRAMELHRSLDDIFACCMFEDEELKSLSCLKCGASGSETLLHFSENCGSDSNQPVKHTFCLPCTKAYVMEKVENKTCQKIICPFVDPASNASCGHEVDVKFVRRALSNQEFKLYLDECFNALLAGNMDAGGNGAGGAGGELQLMHCPNQECNSIMEVMRPHGLVVPILIKEVDELGRTLSPQAWLHYSSHRVRCHACSKNFCSSCKSVPYHMGRSCEEQAAYLLSKHCRYCADQMTPENTDGENLIPAFELICTNEVCQEKKAIACECVLDCGHPCMGIKDEKSHPPCLIEDCPKRQKNLQVESTDLCNICYIEELGSAPIVQLSSCSHFFHASCVADKIDKRWPGVRITFGFMNCSLCQVPMNHDSLMIQQRKQPVDELYANVKEKALMRLTVEKMEKDEKLTDPNSRFYNQPLAYSMACFAYYTCYKCKSFYFGGRRDCEANAAAENRPAEEFVCFSCAPKSMFQGVECKKPEHQEFLLWKCRFCCNAASWFCFGTTHYCEPCHRDNPMDKVKAPRSKFKQCPGFQMCPLKLQNGHAPNGSEQECEQCVGCGLCAEESSKLEMAREKEKLIDEKIKQKDKNAGHSSVQL